MAITRIGFVDYRLENWHANTFLRIFREDLKNRAVIAGCWGMDSANAQAWAQKNGVPLAASVADLDRTVDAYMVLAPSNPETHLELCQKVLPMGKPTFVDKTFAPDLATAQAIFALADQHGARVESTSALRYTNVQREVDSLGRSDLRHMVAWGGGRSYEEYSIHPAELVISCMGVGARSLMRRNDGAYSQVLISFTDGRTAVINVHAHEQAPFAAALTTSKTTRLLSVDSGPMFQDAAAAIVDFVQGKRPPIDRQQTLLIRRILDASMDPRAEERFVDL
jgi:predicted dehydrogenase